MKTKLFYSGQFLKVAMHLRRTLGAMLSASVARKQVVRTCRTIRADHDWAEYQKAEELRRVSI